MPVRLDFTEQYFVTSDLYLKVLSTQVKQATIGKHSPQVSSQVDAFICRVGIWQEFNPSEVRVIPISLGQVTALDGDLPYFT